MFLDKNGFDINQYYFESNDVYIFPLDLYNSIKNSLKKVDIILS